MTELATINGYELQVNPQTISWGYTLVTNTLDTFGGRVIQVLASTIDSISLNGVIYNTKGTTYKNRYVRMRSMEQSMRDIFEKCKSGPVEFNMKSKGWSGAKVYLKSFGNIEFNVSENMFNYKIEMEVDQGFDNIKKATESSVISNLENVVDVGWTRTSYTYIGYEDIITMQDGLATDVASAGTYSYNSDAG